MVDLNDIADGIPSMGGRKLGSLLRRLACDALSGTSIVEVGCWLGAGTAQLALGIKDRERPGEVSLHCFDRWRAQRSEVETAAQKAGLRFTVSENTLPHVRRTLEPFEVPIQFHQGDILHARWDGGPISVYVDDASKGLPYLCHSLSTFGPSWIPGETVILWMDFHYWRKTGAVEHYYQQRFVEAFGDCFVPIDVEGSAAKTSLAMFRYKAPLGTEAWTWLLKQSAEALVAARNESSFVRMRKEIEGALSRIQKIPKSGSWRIAAGRCADVLRLIFAKLRSSKG